MQLKLLVAPAICMLTTAAAFADQPADWTTEVSIVRVSDHAAADPESLRFAGYSLGSWNAWITPADVPMNMRNRALRAETFVVVDIDASGRSVGCRILRASSEPTLDPLVCDRLSRRGSFEPHYLGPGRPAPTQWVMGVRWENIDAATRSAREVRPSVGIPPPSPDAAGWPRLYWSEHVRAESLPDIQAAYPQSDDVPRDAVVGLDLLISARDGITGCAIGVSSGSAALDDAACRVARTLVLAYTDPCGRCLNDPFPLQIVWKRQDSHIRFPLPSRARAEVMGRRGISVAPLRHPADRRAAQTQIYPRQQFPISLAARDYDDLADRTVRNANFGAELRVDAEGRTTACETWRSSGNTAVDLRTCELLVERLRFTVRSDVFGDAAPSTERRAFDLAALQATTK